MAIKKILVPIDFSEGSTAAINYAVKLAEQTNASITLLFVAEPVYFASPTDLYGASANLGLMLEEQQRYGREELNKVVKRLEKKAIKVRVVMQTGVAYQQIVETAKNLGSDLIVMSTHGRTGLTHMLLGSVAERVVRTSPVPVLTLHAPAKAKK